MATPQYDRENTRRVNLKLNKKTDDDIIRHLESQENIQGYLKRLIREDMKNEGDKIMKKSEIISKNRKAIIDAMADRYQVVLDSDGKIQYQIYIWEDGEIEMLEGAQGDNSYLQPKSGEPRDLYYIATVSAPCFYAFDYSDEPEPEDETEREAARQEIIDYLVGEYRQNQADEIIDHVIDEAERDEKYGI